MGAHIGGKRPIFNSLPTQWRASPTRVILGRSEAETEDPAGATYPNAAGLERRAGWVLGSALR